MKPASTQLAHPSRFIEAALIGMGLLFGLVGLLLNQYILGSFLAPDGVIESLRFRAVIWFIQLSFIAWGLVTVVFRHKPSVLNLNLAFISLLIITPCASELFIRSAIALQVDFFRNPRLYAGWLDDDDHWKLHHEWEKSSETLSDFTVDPLLGWSPRKSAQNPLGILAETPYTPDFAKKAILFYGDSFVYGVPPIPISQRIPQQLQKLIPAYPVYNYGVLGYGVDQIYLRFKESHRAFKQPFIIVGLLTLDLDRSILSVYDAPKPFFTLADDQLVLNGPPLPEDTAGWYQQHPPEVISYLAAFITRQGRVVAGGFNQLEMPYKRTEKQQINTKIIEAITAEAHSRQLPLLVVIFYSQWEFETEGWREHFLKTLLTRLEVPYLDTKAIIQREAAERSLKVADFYYYGHLNELGSQIVAEAIADYLGQQSEFSQASGFCYQTVTQP